MMLRKWKVFALALALVALPVIAFAAGMPSRPKFQGVTVSTAGATSADLFMTQAAAAANERIYRFRNNGAGQLQLCSLNDALSVSNCFAVVDRTGAVNDSLTLTATTIDLVGKPVVTGAFAEKIKLNAQDSLGDNYISGYSSDGTTPRWFVGNGNTADNAVHLVNYVSGESLGLNTTGNGAVLINGLTVQSGAFGRMVGGRVGVAGSCSVTSGDYGLGTCTYNGTGDVTVTFTDSFVGSQGCTATTDTAGSGASIFSVATGSVQVRQFITSTGAQSDRNFFLTCIGQ